MGYWEALLYGAVQGITEYLPVSSSAHLILLPKFLKQDDPGLTFDVFLHLGTLMATLLYFWKDWYGILHAVLNRKTQEQKLLKWIVIATIPALIAGALLHQQIETIFRGNWVMATTLVLGGLLLFIVDRISPQKLNVESMTLRETLIVGFAQCLALVPGMSRSGSTMTGGRWVGLDRGSSARFSFLISAPITLAAIVFELRHWKLLFESSIGFGPLLTAGLSSFLFGCLAIGGLLRMIKRFGYLSFAVYRMALAVTILLILGP